MLRHLLVVSALGAFLVACEGGGPALPAPGPNAIEIGVKTEPPGGNVIVDGIPVGPSPQKVKLNPGPHRVKASMSNYYPSADLKIQVGATEPKEITIPLVASH
jgi:hypothetical protein